MKDNLKIGYSEYNTTIIDIKNIDFTDKKLISELINDFAGKYAYADVEHALEISPTGKAYTLMGTGKNVSPNIIGDETLINSIGVHNHPVRIGEIKGDSFSHEDLDLTSYYTAGKQYLISGERRNAFEFAKYYSSTEIETAWNKAWLEVLEKHWENGTKVIYEQEEILQILNLFLEGFVFYENF